LPGARSECAEHLRFSRSLAREKRSAERAGRSGAWEGTCGVSRMCPDKPPSCYPTPTLGESGFERLDVHPCNQSASDVQIVAACEHDFPATGRQELRGPHAVSRRT